MNDRAPAATEALDDVDVIDLFEVHRGPVVLKEKDGRWLYANGEAINLFDLRRRDDWAGKRIEDILAARPDIRLETTPSAEAAHIKNCHVKIGEKVNADYRVYEYKLGNSSIDLLVWRHQGLIDVTSGRNEALNQCDAMDIVHAVDKVRMRLDSLSDSRTAYKSLCQELASLYCISHAVIIGSERRNVIATSSTLPPEKKTLLRSGKLSSALVDCDGQRRWMIGFPIRHNGTIWAALFFERESEPLANSVNVIQLAMRDFATEIDMRYAAKRVKAMLRTQGYMESIVNNSLDCIMLVDAVSMRIVYANQTCYKRLGYERNEITERTPCEINRHMPERNMESLLASVRRTGRKRSFRTHLTCKNGETFPVMIRLLRGQRDGEDDLIICIAKDISDVSRYETEMLESESRFRNLSEYMRNSMEDERLRVSRDVHDIIGGTLSGAIIEMRQLYQAVCSDPVMAAQYATHFDRVIEQCEEALDAARDISTEMRPSILDRFGIMASLDWLKKNFEQHHGIPCSLTISDGKLSERSGSYQATLIDEVQETAPSERLTTLQSTHIFRIAQESLNNIFKHANATQVRITATCTNDLFEMRIFDDGIGMANYEPRLPTMGILGMKERARSANGSLQVKSHPGRGTTVTLRVRMANNKNEDML